VEKFLKMRVCTSAVALVWLLGTASLSVKGFAPHQLPSSLRSSSFTSQLETPRHVSRKSSTSLNMMFDQLSEAITSVAKNLGPKKR